MPVVSRLPSPRSRLGADLLLLLTAAIWGSAFVAQRVAALNLGTYFFNGTRFLLGAVLLLPLAWRRLPTLGRRDWLHVGGLGAILFTASLFQQLGLRYTTAGNAGFITGLYVVLVPLLLALGGGVRPPRRIWLAAGLAAVGLFLLSTGGQFRLAPGDALELIGALFWTLHVLYLARLTCRLPLGPLAAGQYLAVGLLSLAASPLLEASPTPAGWQAAGWTILYTGVLSIAVGYTLQALGQRAAPPADTAILLSLEAPFAAFFGWLLLGEHLGVAGLVGCGLMLAGMLLAQWRRGKAGEPAG